MKTKPQEVPGQITAIVLIFIFIGIIGLLAASLPYTRTTTITLGTESGEKYCPLPGATELVSQSIPCWLFDALMVFMAVISLLFLIEGSLLLNTLKNAYPKIKRFTKIIFWSGVVLALFMLLLFPLGTILGIINLILLFTNKDLICAQQKV